MHPVSLMLKAASESTTYVSLKKDSAVKGVYTKILLKILMKDTFSLAMKVNKTLNQFRKNLVKPSLLEQFVKIVKKVEESSEWLFGVSPWKQ